MPPTIPTATAARLPAYHRALVAVAAAGARTCSSAELASAVGVHPDQVRKDLSHLATRGTRGVGYPVAALTDELTAILGLGDVRNVVLVGVGNLGRALAAYDGFAPRGLRLVALVDVDADVVGRRVGGLEVAPLERLPDLVRRHRATLGIVAVPAAAAQRAADALTAAGVRAILSFAPEHLRVPAGVTVRAVDVATELQLLGLRRDRDDA
jgi:redox-sensing transcriptional repressor